MENKALIRRKCSYVLQQRGWTSDILCFCFVHSFASKLLISSWQSPRKATLLKDKIWSWWRHATSQLFLQPKVNELVPLQRSLEVFGCLSCIHCLRFFPELNIHYRSRALVLTICSLLFLNTILFLAFHILHPKTSRKAALWFYVCFV